MTVCGEPCTAQACLTCLPEERRQDIADFIMQRTLSDIDLSSHDVSDRLITLDCGHIFTVETLDGHCGMGEYYEIDAMGSYVGLKAPPVDYKLPPLCPSCRGPITSARYGRVVKRAILDVLEQNVAGTMSHSLENLNPAMEKLVTSLPGLEEGARKIESGLDDAPDVSPNRSQVASGKITEPLAPEHLSQPAMCSLHGFSADESLAWNQVIKDLLSLYRRIHSVAIRRGAHVQAYEAAITTLYHLALQSIHSDPETAAGLAEPELQAFETAKRDVGQPPHKADSQFQVEAYFRTLELRFMLAQVASSRVDKLPVTLTDSGNLGHRERWLAFIGFVYSSCKEDAQKALVMAQRSSASRQAAQCSVYAIRCEFERGRFDFLVTEKMLPSINSSEGRAGRERLAGDVKAKRTDLENKIAAVKTVYLRNRPTKTMDDMREERKWFEENCQRKVDKQLKELEDLEEFVRKGGMYEPLSMQEMEDIVKAFDFGSSTYLAISHDLDLRSS